MAYYRFSCRYQVSGSQTQLGLRWQPRRFGNKMKRTVYIVSDPRDSNRLLELVDPLERAGFTVVHNEAVGVGDSLIGTANKHLRSGVPVVLCATVNAVARLWARKLVNAAQLIEGCKVLVVEMDEGLDLDHLSMGTVAARHYSDPEGALDSLIKALNSYFPEDAKTPEASPADEMQDFLDQITGATTPSIEALAEFRSQLREDISDEYPQSLSAWEFLQRTYLVREGGLTRAGVLLVGEKPVQVMPSAVIECCEYHGIDRTASSAKTSIFGTLQSQIVQANKYIADRMQRGEAPSPSGPYSQPVYAYPMIAVREIIANAVAHRNYSVTSSCIHVRIFDDRIEIVNPGTWIAHTIGVRKCRIDSLAGESTRRNFRLASMLTWIRLVEGEGKGILAVTADCRAVGAPIPSVLENNGIITVTIFPRQERETSVPLEDSLPAMRTLPGDIATFTGREHELSLLTSAIAEAAVPPGIEGIYVIGGMAECGQNYPCNTRSSSTCAPLPGRTDIYAPARAYAKSAAGRRRRCAG